MNDSDRAFLSSTGAYTSFTFRNTTITFLTSRDLERYIKVLTWDHGYLVVLARYKSRPEEEEYIDLLPILTNLYMDPDDFLDPIKEVAISV